MNLSVYQGYEEKKQHTTQDFAYNTYLCSLPLDFQNVPLHWHADIELIVVKKGRGIIRVDLQTHHVRAGDIILLLPGHLHEILQEDSYSMEYENILFEESLLLPIGGDQATATRLKPLFRGDLLPETVLFREGLPYYDDLWSLISDIDQHCDLRPIGWQLIVKSNLLRIFFILLQHTDHTRPTAHAARSLEKLKVLTTYVEAHISEEITVEMMADLTHYSKAHFMRFFHQQTGSRFTEWLNDYRLSMAARALTSTDDHIIEIAQQNGFYNLSYFNRLFKEKYQMTPRQFRRYFISSTTT